MCQYSFAADHRRMSQGVGLQPPDSGKTIIFRAKAKFFRQKPKNEEKKRIPFHLAR